MGKLPATVESLPPSSHQKAEGNQGHWGCCHPHVTWGWKSKAWQKQPGWGPFRCKARGTPTEYGAGRRGSVSLYKSLVDAMQRVRSTLRPAPAAIRDNFCWTLSRKTALLQGGVEIAPPPASNSLSPRSSLQTKPETTDLRMTALGHSPAKTVKPRPKGPGTTQDDGRRWTAKAEMLNPADPPLLLM